MARYAYNIAEKDPLFEPLHYPELSIFCFKNTTVKTNTNSVFKLIIDFASAGFLQCFIE